MQLTRLKVQNNVFAMSKSVRSYPGSNPEPLAYEARELPMGPWKGGARSREVTILKVRSRSLIFESARSPKISPVFARSTPVRGRGHSVVICEATLKTRLYQRGQVKIHSYIRIYSYPFEENDLYNLYDTQSCSSSFYDYASPHLINSYYCLVPIRSSYVYWVWCEE